MIRRITREIYIDALKSASEAYPRVAMNCSIPNNLENNIYLMSDCGISWVDTRTGVIGGLCRISDGDESVMTVHFNYVIEHGGYILNCYDGILVDLYERYGFNEFNRLKFNPILAPIGWEDDPYLSLHPDVVFMRLG